MGKLPRRLANLKAMIKDEGKGAREYARLAKRLPPSAARIVRRIRRDELKHKRMLKRLKLRR